MTVLRIAGGQVIDPVRGHDETPRDLWIRDGAIIAPPECASEFDLEFRADRVIDARGYVIMPGGVDLHSHIVGPKVNAARLFRPEAPRTPLAAPENLPFPAGRAGSWADVPSSFATGYRYAGLGYTTAIDAAIAPMGARQSHWELRDTPIIDKSFLVLAGNNHEVMDLIREQSHDRLRAYLTWMLRSARGYGLKIVNPGGVERWKQGNAPARGELFGWDDPVDGFGVTPRAIVTGLADAANDMGLPHPVHIHTLNLGIPGNWETTLETIRMLDGRRAHLTHIQFHSYGGDPNNSLSLSSQVAALVDAFERNPHLTADVGQVLFGETTSMTADGHVGEFLAQLTGKKWISHDLERETGCGIVPIVYKDQNLVHAMQWAIGLEWFLRVRDPWRIALTTDHPNGGSFIGYPQIIAFLMSRDLRNEALARMPEQVSQRCGLKELDREYTLHEIAVITRASPARMLGLTRKGHLGPGADADITVYAPNDDREAMFAFPRFVIQNGQIILDNGALRAAPTGKLLTPIFSQPSAADRDFERTIVQKIWDNSSLSPDDLIIGDEEIARIHGQTFE